MYIYFYVTGNKKNMNSLTQRDRCKNCTTKQADIILDGLDVIEKYDADVGSIGCNISYIEDGIPMPPEVFALAEKFLKRYRSMVKNEEEKQLKIKNALKVIQTLLN